MTSPSMRFRIVSKGSDGGSWCVAEAASVFETGKFLEDTDGHSSASSEQCADFILRL